MLAPPCIANSRKKNNTRQESATVSYLGVVKCELQFSVGVREPLVTSLLPLQSIKLDDREPYCRQNIAVAVLILAGK